MQNQKYTFIKDGYKTGLSEEKMQLMNRKERRAYAKANGGFKKKRKLGGDA